MARTVHGDFRASDRNLSVVDVPGAIQFYDDFIEFAVGDEVVRAGDPHRLVPAIQLRNDDVTRAVRIELGELWYTDRQLQFVAITEPGPSGPLCIERECAAAHLGAKFFDGVLRPFHFQRGCLT